MTYPMGVCKLAPEVTKCKQCLESFATTENEANTFVKWWKEWNLDILDIIQKEDITLVTGGTEEDTCWALTTSKYFQQLLATTDILCYSALYQALHGKIRKEVGISNNRHM